MSKEKTNEDKTEEDTQPAQPSEAGVSSGSLEPSVTETPPADLQHADAD